ncbi:MAG: right-handed parallel beta-helix repeat-containing protein [Edaphobacter sp.]
MLTRRSFIGALPALYAVTKCDSLAQIATSGGVNYHVGKNGNDHNDGSSSHPFLTISAAAALAQPGDVINVHEGIYRERINPPRGGTSDAKRIIYQAAPGEHVQITGAEPVQNWRKAKNNVWKVILSNSFFGPFNPYSDLIHGDWFDPKGRKHHTGAVYLNGDWFIEAATLEDVFNIAGETPLWFGQVDENTTTLWAQFKGIDPNVQHVEVNARQTVFYPDKIGINYLTVRGFILSQAATPWAPPTAEQIGIIGTHWSKGWIIENNVVSYSTCSGIALGKYGDQWDNTSENSAEGYVKTIERATQAGWSKENIGGHLVQNNTVSHCEQAGIVGSLGAVFSVVTRNTIRDIHVRRLFTGAEMAGIKFHAAIDTEISHNYIHRTCLGVWLDWMAQGTHVYGNLFHNNRDEDLMVEVDHGPFVVDNNIFLSITSQRIVSQGGAYLHNLFCGGVKLTQLDDRMTPFMKPHSTQIAGYHNNPSGDMRFYNNIFAKDGDLTPYNETRLPMYLAGNVFLKDSQPCSKEASPLLQASFDPLIKLVESANALHLEINLDSAWLATQHRSLITTVMLGKASIPNLPFERADGAHLSIDTDYTGRRRDPSNPFPGPFESPNGGHQTVEIWPATT